ncbi:hypothetical protein [Rathayibacter soli]|uniref:hypothetical protein n=1 Tax=Rathayibacter soli TaxID=3144168 RepID=UPI0027E3F08B|nr:hypothetical protein [Glaciibacter superstes]
MDRTERTLLGTALRARPRTTAELAALVERPLDHVVALLTELEHEGLMRLDGDVIHYRSPDRLVADRVTALITQHEQRLLDGLAEIQDLVRDLPGLVNDWAIGVSPDAPALGVELLHGPDAGTELWRRQLPDGAPLFAAAVLPDLHRFYLPDVAEQQRFIERMATRGAHARAIVTAAETRHPSIQAQLARFAAAGIEIRMHPRPPSWFWIHDDHTIGIPLKWGEAWPTSVMALHSESITSMVRTLFEQLWREAVPTTGADRSWDPLLRLMRNGATLDAASRWLGITPRTGRRRIASAMEHYGTETLFALGTAWAEAGESSGPQSRAT